MPFEPDAESLTPRAVFRHPGSASGPSTRPGVAAPARPRAPTGRAYSALDV